MGTGKGENKMSILIKGMKMPKDGECIVIASHGTAYKYELGDVVMYGDAYNETAEAIELPPHGRLIDADAFNRNIANLGMKYDPFMAAGVIAFVNDASVIIPADPEKEDA